MWKRYGELWGPEDAPNHGIQGIYLKRPADGQQVPNIWHTEDLAARGLSPDATAVMLLGILIISGWFDKGTYGLTLAVRRHGSTAEPPYIAQASTESAGLLPSGNFNPGSRESALIAMCPVTNGKLQWKWGYQVPPGSNMGLDRFGINLVVSGFTRLPQV